jgi:signal transduction histidine kinase
LKDAGGIVIAQSEETSEYTAMPLAAVEAGAVDLVLDLADISGVVVDVVRGGELPRARADRTSAGVLFAGPGEMPALFRRHDWRRTRLGPVTQWPDALVAVLQTALNSPVATCVLWGPDLLQLYNDAYRVLIGPDHGAELGRPRNSSEPLYSRVLSGEAVARTEVPCTVTGDGSERDAWFDLTYGPIRERHGRIGGILTTVTDRTAEVLSRRRLQLLHRLATGPNGAPTRGGSLERSLATLGADRPDIPFALVYLVDGARMTAELAGLTGVDRAGPMAPSVIALDQETDREADRKADRKADREAIWPIGAAVRLDQPVVVDRLAETFPGSAAEAAVAIPLHQHHDADDVVGGVLVLGVNPRLPLNDSYREFLSLAAGQIAASLAEATGRQHQREHADRTAALDQVRTEFLSDISDELRTPLTLLLGNLETLNAVPGLSPSSRADVAVAARNARRLQVMVDTMLDFSAIEAGRLGTRLALVDLAALTTDIARPFHDAAAHAGLVLRVDCPPMTSPVAVDPVLWEKVVAHLLSNALKFTFTGEIAVELRELPEHVQLVVSDTGVGIPRDQLPLIFQRFHRVRGTPARSHDGTGLGLALVDQLARRHHGRVRAQSTPGEGSRFTVWLPTAQRRRGEDPVPIGPADAGHPVADALAEAAGFWDIPRVP